MDLHWIISCVGPIYFSITSLMHLISLAKPWRLKMINLVFVVLTFHSSFFAMFDIHIMYLYVSNTCVYIELHKEYIIKCV